MLKRLQEAGKFRRVRYFIYSIAIFFGYSIFFCVKTGFFTQQNRKSDDYNIILIVVDCLRADHLSCYGYFKKTSPYIDNFSQRAIKFKQAVSQASNTLLSFSSIFTSQYVSTHGVNTIDKRLDDSALTLAEVLRMFNYRTAAFVGGPFLNPVFKLDQGFDTYDYIQKIDSSFKDTMPLALKWLKEIKRKKEKFFLLLHGNDLHTPYTFDPLLNHNITYRGRLYSLPLSGEDYFMIYKKRVFDGDKIIMHFNDDDTKYIIAQYDNKISYIDKLIGDFLDRLNKLKLLNNTIVILTSDHGEGLFDHDYFFHDFNLYESTLRVPLLIQIPFSRASVKEITCQVQLIDLMPTIFELIGIEINKQAEGHSFMALFKNMNSNEFNRYIFSETPHGEVSIRTDEWKLINFSDRIELYNLKLDPEEKQNLSGKKLKISGCLTEEIKNWRAQKRRYFNLGQQLSADKELMEKTSEREKKRKQMYGIPKRFSGL